MYTVQFCHTKKSITKADPIGPIAYKMSFSALSRNSALKVERESSSVEQKGNTFVSFSCNNCANVGKEFLTELTLKLTGKQKGIGRHRPQIQVQGLRLFLTMATKKIIGMMITSDFDGWGGSHAGSVNTGMEIEEKLSGGLKPSTLLSWGPLPQVFGRAV